MDKEQISLLATSLVMKHSLELMRLPGSTPADLIRLLTYANELAKSIGADTSNHASAIALAEDQAKGWFKENWDSSGIKAGSPGEVANG